MFKKNLQISFLALLLALTGCLSAPPLPKADLSKPGWTVRQGQAVWRAKRGSPEIAGEILLATNRSGRTLVQFTKTPFPLIIAQQTINEWQIESPAQNKRYTGRGEPPRRMIWFQLPKALAGSTLPNNWIWRASTNDWHLENLSSGELLEGYFTP